MNYYNTNFPLPACDEPKIDVKIRTLAEGLHEHFYRIFDEKRKLWSEQVEIAQRNNEAMLKLWVIKDELSKLDNTNTTIWNKTKLEKAKEALTQEAYEITKEELDYTPEKGKSIYYYIGRIVNAIEKSVMRYPTSLHSNIITAILLQTNELETKSFKDLIAIVDEQSGFSASY